MTSKTSSRPVPISFDVNPSPETMYHFPMSPSEPGKFDFYRVHLANHANHSDSMFSDNFDVPLLSTSTVSSAVAKRRWTPFADLVSTNSTATLKSQTVSSTNPSVLSNINVIQNESGSSLTSAVKNALNKGHLDVPGNKIRRPISGATLSSKDLNHLSPQSM